MYTRIIEAIEMLNCQRYHGRCLAEELTWTRIRCKVLFSVTGSQALAAVQSSSTLVCVTCLISASNMIHQLNILPLRTCLLMIHTFRNHVKFWLHIQYHKISYHRITAENAMLILITKVAILFGFTRLRTKLLVSVNKMH